MFVLDKISWLGLIIFNYAICHFCCWTNFLGLVNFVLDFRSITFFMPLKGSIILLRETKCNYMQVFIFIFNLVGWVVGGHCPPSPSIVPSMVLTTSTDTWYRADHYDLPGLLRMPEIISQGKKELVKIIGLGFRITQNLVGWNKTAFWAIVVTLPWGTPWKWQIPPFRPRKLQFCRL